MRAAREQGVAACPRMTLCWPNQWPAMLQAPPSPWRTGGHQGMVCGACRTAPPQSQGPLQVQAGQEHRRLDEQASVGWQAGDDAHIMIHARAVTLHQAPHLALKGGVAQGAGATRGGIIHGSRVVLWPWYEDICRSGLEPLHRLCAYRLLMGGHMQPARMADLPARNGRWPGAARQLGLLARKATAGASGQGALAAAERSVPTRKAARDFEGREDGQQAAARAELQARRKRAVQPLHARQLRAD